MAFSWVTPASTGGVRTPRGNKKGYGLRKTRSDAWAHATGIKNCRQHNNVDGSIGPTTFTHTVRRRAKTKDPWRGTTTKKDILYRDAVLGEAASHLLVDRARAGLDTGRPFCGHLCGLSSTA